MGHAGGLAHHSRHASPPPQACGCTTLSHLADHIAQRLALGWHDKDVGAGVGGRQLPALQPAQERRARARQRRLGVLQGGRRPRRAGRCNLLAATCLPARAASHTTGTWVRRAAEPLTPHAVLMPHAPPSPAVAPSAAHLQGGAVPDHRQPRPRHSLQQRAQQGNVLLRAHSPHVQQQRPAPPLGAGAPPARRARMRGQACAGLKAAQSTALGHTCGWA